MSSPTPRLPWGPVSKIPAAPIHPAKLLPEPSPEDASNPDDGLIDLPGQVLNLVVETITVDGSKVASVASPADSPDEKQKPSPAGERTGSGAVSCLLDPVVETIPPSSSQLSFCVQRSFYADPKNRPSSWDPGLCYV